MMYLSRVQIYWFNFYAPMSNDTSFSFVVLKKLNGYGDNAPTLRYV